MRPACACVAAGALMIAMCGGATASAQTMDPVEYFLDSIAEKGDRNHFVRLSGGSEWVLAKPTPALVATDIMVVMRNVNVEGKVVQAAWMYIDGEEIPMRHLAGVYPKIPALLTRVLGADRQQGTLRLADGAQMTIPVHHQDDAGRWTPPYKALLTNDRTHLYNLTAGRRIDVRPAASAAR